MSDAQLMPARTAQRLEPNPSTIPPASASILPRLVTMDRFQDLYGVSRSLAYELIADGLISSIKIGRRRLIDVESVESYVATLKVGNPGQSAPLGQNHPRAA